MSLFADFWSWVRRLFGHRPNPTQALREELARHRPTGQGPQKAAVAPPVKPEAAAPYPRGSSAPSAPSTAVSGEAPPAPLPQTPPPPPPAAAQPKASAPAEEPRRPAPAEPEKPNAGFFGRLDSSEASPIAPKLSEPPTPDSGAVKASGIAVAAPLLDAAALEIPEPPTAAAPLASAPLEPPSAAPATPDSAPATPAPAPEHSSEINLSLSKPPQHGGMKIDIAFPAAAAAPAPPSVVFAEEEDQEDLVDLAFVDEDMEALDARALGRARPLLTAPPLDTLVTRWRIALAPMRARDETWALFKHGTLALFDAPPRNAEAEARELLRGQGQARYGAPEPEVVALPNGAGWLVGGSHPRLLTYVSPEEASATTPLHVIGRLGRAKRDEDARSLEIAHVENDPFWRPPED